MAEEALRKSPRIAVDTNFVIDCGDEEDAAVTAYECIVERCILPKFIVTPTVLQELAFLAKKDTEPEVRDRTLKALKTAVRLNFKPQSLNPVDNGIVEEIARSLRGPDLIPENEINDSEILVEASLMNCDILLTNDRHLTELERNKLEPILKPVGSVPLIVWPKKLTSLLWPPR